ncbi:unnamed protein product [Rotaria sp. Silwood1]|nr:unnamed protein product [Rotaria sp. Silwood1]CAF1369218.1 unnamed protein product [Rotaria sp. Silwood1]CAF3543156.1 unnamed protein product [Rotaria sp. Silwood1]CAF4788080.1 unnamed protein product [Rotaria sp. Silwood1]CAF4822621.1 unnamed protein product [Rotaria sp. Silwood1]
MKAVTINEKEKEKLIGYNCIYRYGTYEFKLEYSILTAKWTIVNDKHHSEEVEKQLNTYITRINELSWVDMGYTLDERIQHVLRSFDGYLSGFKAENNEHQLQENSNSSEKNVVDNGCHSLTTPSVVPHRNHQNNEYSTRSSVQYTSFIRPLTGVVRQRRIIESIYLRIQRKKKKFEKIVDLLNGTESSTMYELGLEFLRVYDGKFNYPEGHTVIKPNPVQQKKSKSKSQSHRQYYELRLIPGFPSFVCHISSTGTKLITHKIVETVRNSFAEQQG